MTNVFHSTMSPSRVLTNESRRWQFRLASQSRSSSASSVAARDLDLAGLGLFALRKRYAKHAVLELGRRTFGRNRLRQRERPRERAIAALDAMIVVLLGLFLKFRSPLRVRTLFSNERSKSSRFIPGSSASRTRWSLFSKISTLGLHAPCVISSRPSCRAQRPRKQPCHLVLQAA